MLKSAFTSPATTARRLGSARLARRTPVNSSAVTASPALTIPRVLFLSHSRHENRHKVAPLGDESVYVLRNVLRHVYISVRAYTRHAQIDNSRISPSPSFPPTGAFLRREDAPRRGIIAQPPSARHACQFARTSAHGIPPNQKIIIAASRLYLAPCARDSLTFFYRGKRGRERERVRLGTIFTVLKVRARCPRPGLVAPSAREKLV